MVKYPKGIKESDIEVEFDNAYDPSGLKLRYSLVIKLDNLEGVRVEDNTVKKSKLTAIMMNPSKANKNQSDRTVNKIIRVAKKYGYRQVAVYNSIPFYETRSSMLSKVTKKLFEEYGEKTFESILKQNFERIRNVISLKDTDILLATGNPKNSLIRKQMDAIYANLQGMEIRYYKQNTSGYYSHPLYKSLVLTNKRL